MKLDFEEYSEYRKKEYQQELKKKKEELLI